MPVSTMSASSTHFARLRNAALTASLLASLFAAGCDSGGGSDKPRVPVTGTVEGDEPVAGAAVSFIEASRAADLDSLQPLEDSVPLVTAATDAAGRFTAEVPEGSYFVLVGPPSGDETHLPGGSLSRESIPLDRDNPQDLAITLSERPPEGATYVGSSTCLGCHVERVTVTETLHFLGFRRLTAAGPVLSSLQDLSRFPDANQGLGYYDDGNPNDNTGSGADGYGYKVATTNGYDILLGKDGTGYFQALQGPGGFISERLYIAFTYGGEGRFRQRYVTRLDVLGGYTSSPADGSYHVLPAQYNEVAGDPDRGNEVTVPGWVTCNPERWGPPAVDGGSASIVPATRQSFDNDCAGCHFTGMALTRTLSGLFQAHAVPDPGGPFDFDGDGSAEEMNIGCERCHGPGSAHVADGTGRYIVNPDHLPPGRAAMICGQCHTRGTGNGTIDGEGRGGYPSRNHPTTGDIEFVKPGIRPAEFFGTPNGLGILPDFGTSGGYLSPVNFATDADASWQDRSGGHGSRFDHTKLNRAQYLDHARSGHLQNPYDMVACWDCHDPHRRERHAQAAAPVDNNVLCFRCHAGHGDFAEITQEMVDAVEAGEPQPGQVNAGLNTHVKYNTFDLVGVAMNLGADSYSNPIGNSALGRCVVCHMTRTARSASDIVDDQGYVIEGDVAAHTFDVISPAVSRRMAEADKDPVPNSCVPCHRGPPRGAYPDYRYKP